MSTAQHFADMKNLKGKHVKVDDALDGGRCLNRHQARATNSCSHQWQAQRRGETEIKKIYNWPAYKDMKAAKQVFFQGKTANVGKPSNGDWDAGAGDNFKHCNKPYFHEAHHIVPNSTLKKAIDEAFKKASTIRYIRGALLDAGYNLNHMSNMINLPLDTAVANALKLPRHRVLPRMHHNDYSVVVQEQLVKKFAMVAAVLDDHDDATIGNNLKEWIVAYAGHLFWQILEAGREPDMTALDEVAAEWLHPPDEFFDDDLGNDDKGDDDDDVADMDDE